jgi:hypothetical protein
MLLPLRITQRILGKDGTSHIVRLTAAAAGLTVLAVIGWNVDWLRHDRRQPDQVSSELSETDLQLEVQYQLAEERGAFHVLSADDPPLRDGDKVQIHVRAALPLYLYLYWSDSHGNSRRLWPMNLDRQRQRERVTLLVPQQRDEWFPIDGASGNELVWVAATRTPLSTSQLAQFDKLPQLSPSDDTISAPLPLHAGEASRGVGGIVSAENNLLNRDFLRSLADQFIGYRGWVFPHR